MIHTIKFEASHAMTLLNDSSDAMAFACTIREMTSIGVTAVNDDMILGCAGLTIDENRNGSLWTVTTEILKREHPIWFVRTASRLFMPAVIRLGLLRVEMLISPDSKADRRWATWMGFRKESTKKRAGRNGTDLDVYVFFPEHLSFTEETQIEGSA